MYRNYPCVEMLLFVLLSHLHWEGPSFVFHNCTRHNSRIVRALIHKKILPIFQKYKLNPPINCLFNMNRDVLWWADADKHYDRSHWKCPVCEETFLAEEELEQHWDKNHIDHLTQPEDSICLSSLCDIFRCDIVIKSFESPFPNNQSFSAHQFQRASAKFSCNEKYMAFLNRKCKTVIHNCLLESLLSLSTKDFIDIEDELDSSICSYLDCQRYWDESFVEVRHVPLSFCIILMLFLFGVFYFCYYIILMLLNSTQQYFNKSQCNGFINNTSRGVTFRTKPKTFHHHSRYPYSL